MNIVAALLLCIAIVFSAPSMCAVTMALLKIAEAVGRVAEAIRYHADHGRRP